MRRKEGVSMVRDSSESAPRRSSIGRSGGPPMQSGPKNLTLSPARTEVEHGRTRRGESSTAGGRLPALLRRHDAGGIRQGFQGESVRHLKIRKGDQDAPRGAVAPDGEGRGRGLAYGRPPSPRLQSGPDRIRLAGGRFWRFSRPIQRGSSPCCWRSPPTCSGIRGWSHGGGLRRRTGERLRRSGSRWSATPSRGAGSSSSRLLGLPGALPWRQGYARQACGRRLVTPARRWSWQSWPSTLPGG